MLNYSIEEQVVQNILVFLNRTQLEGHEAGKLVQAMYILQNPIQAEQPKQQMNEMSVLQDEI